MTRLNAKFCGLTLLLWFFGGFAMVFAIPAQMDLSSVPHVRLDQLFEKHIFFGHQSVGYNIIEGVSDALQSREHRNFKFIESRMGIPDGGGPAFYHATIGHNADPRSKIDDFVHIMDAGTGRNCDIAMMKFCYVDIVSGTDVKAVFTKYRNSMAKLKAAYPLVTLVHVTVPLTARGTGLKGFLKDLSGRNAPTDGDNMAREAYNELLRTEYAGREPLFDLALLEATDRNGKADVREKGGASFYSLRDEYTSDGGHLNVPGKRYIGEQFLAFLASLPEKR